jgi:crotonobetaine/carnitine-CoA ligase
VVQADFLSGGSGTIDALVRWRAVDSPDKAFAQSGNRTITYSELDKITDRLATGLSDLGVTRGDSAAIYMANGLEFVFSMLACFRLGAVAVPCSTHYTADELIYQLGHSGAILVITDAERAPLVSEALSATPAVREVVCLTTDDLPDGWRSFSDVVSRTARAAVLPAPSASDLALIIYTSGTTARPKGVVLTQGNLVTSVHNVVSTYQMTARDRILHFFPMYHVNGGLVSLLPSLAVGATVVFVDRFSASSFGKQLYELDITYCNLNSTNVKMILASPPTSFDSAHHANRMLLGLSLADDQRREFERRFNSRLCPTYGMTETLGVVASESPGGPRRYGSAGRVLRGYEIEIRDAEGRAATPGEIGRICIRGLQRHALAAHYFNDPELSRQAFVDGWLLTGDIGYADDDGYLFYVGRLHDVIKRSGYNVSPAEIERVIGEVSGVKDVAVVSTPEPVREEAIVVYLTAQTHVREADIFAACSLKLAPYKLPQVVRIVDELPLTFIGKVDRAQLREWAAREMLSGGES